MFKMRFFIFLCIWVHTACYALQDNKNLPITKGDNATYLCPEISQSNQEKLIDFQKRWALEKRNGFPGLLLLPPSPSPIHLPMLFINDGTKNYCVLRKSSSNPEESFPLKLIKMANAETCTGTIHDILNNRIVIFEPVPKQSCTYKKVTYPLADLISFPPL